LAPVFVAIFDGLGFWWGLPLLSAALLAGLLAVSLPLPLYAGAQARGAGRSMAGIPARFWVFGAFAVLYGICETMNGNWAQLDMTRQLGASTTQAALALTTFWAMATAGRVLFALVQRWLPTRTTYRLLPFVLAVALVVVACSRRARRRWGCSRSGWPAWAARRCCPSPSASARRSWWRCRPRGHLRVHRGGGGGPGGPVVRADRSTNRTIPYWRVRAN
jgi:hypothetical protein